MRVAYSTKSPVPIWEEERETIKRNNTGYADLASRSRSILSERELTRLVPWRPAESFSPLSLLPAVSAHFLVFPRILLSFLRSLLSRFPRRNHRMCVLLPPLCVQRIRVYVWWPTLISLEQALHDAFFSIFFLCVFVFATAVR